MTEETKDNQPLDAPLDDQPNDAADSNQGPEETSALNEAEDTDLVIDDQDDIEVEENEESDELDAAEAAAAELSDEERLQRVAMLKPIIEGAIMAAGETLKLTRMQSLFDEHEIPSKGLLIEVLENIQQDCAERGFQLIEVSSGWRFQVREDYAPWVNRLWDEKPQKYSRALLETLALIAYRQPLTRGDIEEVRGVAVSSHIIKTLTERDWVKVVGHRDVPGRPSLYATTKTFLDYFNLKSLDELPSLGELQDIESLNASLELESQLPPEMIAEMKAEDASAESDAAEADLLTGTSDETAEAVADDAETVEGTEEAAVDEKAKEAEEQAEELDAEAEPEETEPESSEHSSALGSEEPEQAEAGENADTVESVDTVEFVELADESADTIEDGPAETEEPDHVAPDAEQSDTQNSELSSIEGASLFGSETLVGAEPESDDADTNRQSDT